MVVENYNYTYEVYAVDIETGTFQVEYVPESTDIAPLRINIGINFRDFQTILDADGNTIYNSQEEVPFSEHLLHSVKTMAPMRVWKTQFTMLNNLDQLQNATGTVSDSV